MTEAAKKHYIGIDVSKPHLDVYDSRDGRYHQVKNTISGISALLAKLGDLSNCHFVLEATGGYEQRSLKYIAGKSLAITLVQPDRVRAYGYSTGRLAKTDKLDAKLLSDFGATHELRIYKLPEETQQHLSLLSARNEQLTQMIVAEKNRYRGLLDKTSGSASIKAQSEQLIALLESQKASVASEMDSLILSDEDLSRKRDVLVSVTGIGEASARALLAELPELGTEISDSALSALVGVAPFNRDSGKRKGYRFIRGGRAQVRTALHMVILSAKVHNPPIKAFYDRLIKKGKPKLVAMVACARKLLCILNHLFKTNAPWDPCYHKRFLNRSA